MYPVLIEDADECLVAPASAEAASLGVTPAADPYA